MVTYNDFLRLQAIAERMGIRIESEPIDGNPTVDNMPWDWQGRYMVLMEKVLRAEYERYVAEGKLPPLPEKQET